MNLRDPASFTQPELCLLSGVSKTMKAFRRQNSPLLIRAMRPSTKAILLASAMVQASALAQAQIPVTEPVLLLPDANLSTTTQWTVNEDGQVILKVPEVGTELAQNAMAPLTETLVTILDKMFQSVSLWVIGSSAALGGLIGGIVVSQALGQSGLADVSDQEGGNEEQQSNRANKAPVFTSGTTASFAENGIGTTYTASATDADGDVLSYSISGGSDASRCSINPTSGALSFNSIPDFEAPSDSNIDNAYVVSLQASDGNGGTAAQTVTVTVTDELDTATSLTLTTGTDEFSPTAASAADQTTSFNDSITGVVGGLGGTLQAADLMDGDQGTDSASFDMAGNFGGFTGDGGMESVEMVTLSNTSTFSRTFDASGVSGVTAWNLMPAGGGISLDDVGDLNASISVDDQASGSFTLDWVASAVSGTSDSLSVSLTDIGTAGTGVSQKIVEAKVVGIEELDVTSSGTNVVKFTEDAATKLTLSGSGSTKITEVSTALTEFDASGLTGELDADLQAITGANALISVKSGSNDDIIVVDTADLGIAADINMGSGTGDRLELKGGGATFQPMMSGVEEVVFSNTGVLTFSAIDTFDVDRFVASQDMSDDLRLVHTGLSSVVTLEGANASGAKGVTSDASGSLSVEVSKPADGTSSSLTNQLDVTAAAATSTLAVTVDSGMIFRGQITADSILSTVSIAIDGTVDSTAEVHANAAQAISITSVDNDSVFDLDASSATQMSIVADKNLDLDEANSDLGKIQQINASINSFLDLGVDSGANHMPFFEAGAFDGNGSVELGNLGSATLEENMTVLADGLSTLEIGTLNTKGGTITVDASGTLGHATLGAIVNADNLATTPGDVGLEFGLGGFGAGVTTTGRNVEFDAANVLINNNSMTHNVEETFSYTGSGVISSGMHSVTPTGSSLTVVLDGNGAKDDLVTVTGDDSEDTTNYTLQGDMGTGGTNDKLTVDASAENDAGAVTIDGSAITSGALDLTGTSSGDTITGGKADDTISGLAGADIIDLTQGGLDTLVLANVATIKATADTVTGFGTNDSIDIQATAAGEFADLHDAGGSGFTGANAAAVSTVNIAGGAADLVTTAAKVIAINADTSELTKGYTDIAALQTAVDGAAITEEGTSVAFDDGGKLLIVWYDTDDDVYEVGIITVAGGNGFDGADETYESLLQIDDTYTTLADVADSINYIAQQTRSSLGLLPRGPGCTRSGLFSCALWDQFVSLETPL